MAIHYKRIVALLIAFAGGLGVVHAQMPSSDKPVRLVVPFVAGSAVDTVARALGNAMSASLKQVVVVDNKPGANAQVGADSVLQSPADGLTLLLGTMDSHALNPLVYSKLRYDPVRDFAPIGLIGTQNLVLVARKGAPFSNGRELIAEARKSPGRLSFGSWGLGSVAHVWIAMMEHSANVEFLHVPHQGTPQALNLLLGDQLDLLFLPPLLAKANQETGKVKIIGSTAAKRGGAVADIPTLAEQGFTGFDGTTWFALFSRSGIAPDVQDKLNGALNAALQDPKVRETLNGISMVPAGGKPDVLSRTMASSRDVLARAINERKIKLLD